MIVAERGGQAGSILTDVRVAAVVDERLFNALVTRISSGVSPNAKC